MREALLQIVGLHPDWWFFPEESSVQGFLGTGRIFIVGDQPSTDRWEIDHPHRRAFYDLLVAEGAGDCHLTDFYKRRGLAGELRINGIPSDFNKHLKVFLKEVELLRPSTILALGWDAYRLLLQTPELNGVLKKVGLERIWHFGTVRHGNRVEFQARLRRAIIAARQRDLK
ncbi:MAG TPA: hypothetical protein VIK53_19620 [Verrucomicrobiae bacterium]